MTRHVAMLMGGWSVEREVSLRSGEGCAKALESVGYRVTRIDVKPDIGQVLTQLKPDVAFNALHGRFGEDGAIQGLLEILRSPACSPRRWPCARTGRRSSQRQPESRLRAA
jgi:D-alanine-D-alanine ligase